jgi:sec-independent protein translocase protein TatA
MGSVSPIHWIIVAVVLLMLFGPKTLSKVGKTAGRTVRTAAKVKQSITDVPGQVLNDITRVDPGRKSGG